MDGAHGRRRGGVPAGRPRQRTPARGRALALAARTGRRARRASCCASSWRPPPGRAPRWTSWARAAPRPPEAGDAAAAAGAELAALATSPLPVEPTLSPKPRYREMGRRFGLTASEELTCGCHVHVAIDSEDEGVGALDRIRPWLAPLLALTANSPFWQGVDSGYASYRSQVWSRWPSAGPYAPVRLVRGLPRGRRGDAGQRHRARPRDGLLRRPALRGAPDGGGAGRGRLPRRRRRRAARRAGARGWSRRPSREWRAGTPADPVRLELLRLASWRAGRSGVDGVLLDPCTWRPVLARRGTGSARQARRTGARGGRRPRRGCGSCSPASCTAARAPGRSAPQVIHARRWRWPCAGRTPDPIVSRRRRRLLHAPTAAQLAHREPDHPYDDEADHARSSPARASPARDPSSPPAPSPDR